MSYHKNLLIFVQKAAEPFIIFWENNHFNTSRQILNRKEGHRLIISCKFDGLARDHSTDNNMRIVHDLNVTGFFLPHKIHCIDRCILLDLLEILFKRVSAQIDAQYLFFKTEKHFFRELPDIRVLYLKIFLILFRYKIKQAHLS